MPPENDDPIPILPLPAWLERAILQAIRILIAAALANVVKGANPSGKAHL